MITKVRNLSQAMVMQKNFEHNPNTTTGLTFGYFEGNVQDAAGAIVNFPASTIVIPSGGTYILYADLDADPVILKTGALASITSPVFIPLYEISTGGSITSIVDLRSPTLFQIGPE